MRVALVSESFLPAVNGVTNSVVRAAAHLRATGHTPYVVAPGPGPDVHDGVPVRRVPSLGLPGYRDFRLARPSYDVTTTLAGIAPDVVHLASPVVLGRAGAEAAEELGIPAVAVFQTDLAAFARRYHLGASGPLLWSHLRRVHNRCAVTLAPSTAALCTLRRHGVERVHLWGRGVDLARFTPGRRREAVRRSLAPGGELVVGYVGRLAREKNVEALAALQDLPGVRVVVVGDGPVRARLQRQMPHAHFAGFLHGEALADTVAAFDLFVHPGRGETFCQAVQEALASGVPVVACADGGPLDLVRHGENGLLWAGDDPWLLRATVDWLAGEPELRARLGDHARRSVLGRTWASVGDGLVAHYRAVTGTPEPALARSA